MTRDSRTQDETTDSPIVVWLRNDLRLDDNPALAAAAETDRPVVPLVVLDEGSEGLRPLGGAHKWWLHHTLEALGRDLEAKGTPLILRRGDSRTILPEVIRQARAGALFYNRRYHVAARAMDEAVEAALDDIDIERFDANILHEPDKVKTKTGGYYKVYTPFWKNLTSGRFPRDPIDAPKTLKGLKNHAPKSDSLKDWGLLPEKPDWSGDMASEWEPGEAAAHERFATFCDEILNDYHNSRERPGIDGTSGMSPYLRFGVISPHRLWHEAEAVAARRKSIPGAAIETFRKELVWRDFNYHLLYHFGRVEDENINARFDRLPWRQSAKDLTAWQKGMTGYPIVDAAMRQLWRIGWMHNRMRMVVGSFLTKDLLIDWREGERWFWDTLIDGDAASNTSQWQWIAGSGADAQPFFRIFNPVAQGQKFDAAGDYIRRWVPELAKLSDKAIHAPWLADGKALEKAGVELGETYPRPIVDHGEARDRALAAYRSTRAS